MGGLKQTTHRTTQKVPVLVMGLGVSGVSALRWLVAQGWQVVATDSRAAPKGIEALRAEYPQVNFLLGGFAAPSPLSQFGQAVVSPGVSLNEPLVRELDAAGVEIVGDIELFARAVPAEVPRVAITGTNGKSTVTTLLGEMARAAGLKVAVGGNLGTPALDLIAKDVELYVLELSSFQLETTASLAPTVAVWLNLSEDHLDRHGSLENYAAAKARVFMDAANAVVNRDDEQVMRRAPSDAVSFGLSAPAAGHYGLIEDAGQRWLACGGQRLVSVATLRMVGLQNVANGLAALAAAEMAGIPRAVALSALCSFAGLPHRCEWVAECGGVTWVNDSKGTNVGATLAALKGFSQPIVWLGGGQGKGQNFEPLRAPLVAHGRAALVFGEDAGVLERTLSGAVALECLPDLDAALVRAAAWAQPGDCVLLSPACASLDQFTNYAARGERFRAGVKRICAEQVA